MKQSQSTLGQKITARLYALVLFALRCSDVRLVALLGKGIGYIAWACIASRRKIVKRNLRIVIDPTLRPAQLAPLARRNIVLTCMNFACALKVGLMRAKEMEASIQLEGKDIFEDAGTGGRTGIACIPHAGNWEVLARIRPLFTKVEHFASMYRRMGNPALEDMVYKSRTAFGCEMYSKEDGVRGVLRMAKQGGLLGVLSDQFTQEGMWVPYFGKITGTTPLPSVLRKMCKGQLFSVFTRNRGLGQWDAVLGRTIETQPNSINQSAADTIAINQALERVQKENILDGFWMHHRWKCTNVFAPKQDASIHQLAMEQMRIPFRIIVTLPSALEEALCTLPALRLLKASRPDAQLLVICPEAQLAFWRGIACVDRLCSNDAATPLKQQLEEESIYKDGPFDILFMWNDCKADLQAIKSQGPLHISGFADSPLAKYFTVKYPRHPQGPPQARYLDYLHPLQEVHSLDLDSIDATAAEASSAAASEEEPCFLAPFSTLGQADSWAEEQWRQLIALGGSYQVLALEQDAEPAKQMAQSLGIPYQICSLGDLPAHLHPGRKIVAVDGAIAQIAALYGAGGAMLMASRLPDCYAPWCKGMQIFYHHAACHPCYEQDCQQGQSCLTQIEAKDIAPCLQATPIGH